MRTIVLGAGVTGLSAGLSSGYPVLERSEAPGGICCSYYMERERADTVRTSFAGGGQGYRFEVGGGHWIFGSDPCLATFLGSFGTLRPYERRSSVFFPKEYLYVPYPLQYNLRYLPKDIRAQAVQEISISDISHARTMADCITERFGPTLTALFFGPFHRLYTAGLWERIAPQDAYKSPLDMSLVQRGAVDNTPPSGYNSTFIYPDEGLGVVMHRMGTLCDLRLGQGVIDIDLYSRVITLSNGTSVPYASIVSTLPLNRALALCGMQAPSIADPFTSVLVLNIGASRGKACPNDHWVYLSESSSGFHRVGFYSNVHPSFLPGSFRSVGDKVGIYVERAYRGGEQPNAADTSAYATSVIKELQSWDFIKSVDVADASWIDVAYTWTWPGSQWRSAATEMLSRYNIFSVGRYGKWHFQGIAESIQDGLAAGRVSPHKYDVQF